MSQDLERHCFSGLRNRVCLRFDSKHLQEKHRHRNRRHQLQCLLFSLAQHISGSKIERWLIGGAQPLTKLTTNERGKHVGFMDECDPHMSWQPSATSALVGKLLSQPSLIVYQQKLCMYRHTCRPEKSLAVGLSCRVGRCACFCFTETWSENTSFCCLGWTLPGAPGGQIEKHGARFRAST